MLRQSGRLALGPSGPLAPSGAGLVSRRCQSGGRGGKFKLTHLQDMRIRTGPPNLASLKEMILIFFLDFHVT